MPARAAQYAALYDLGYQDVEITGSIPVSIFLCFIVCTQRP